MNSNIYWERQSGDLCRLHSINAYFGFKKLDQNSFFNYCSEYDELIKGLKTQGMDGFSEGRCIISYILDKLDSKYIFLIPINSYNGIRNHIDIDRYNKLIPKLLCYFEFNKGHVWINKKINGLWYKIDSISGVNRIDNPIIKNNGYLLVIDGKHLYNEIFYTIKLIHENQNNEIYYTNLYYSLKSIKLNTIAFDSKCNLNELIKYNKQISLLSNIKENLLEIVENNRRNTKCNYSTINQKINLFINI
tara:strand:- start:68 stop:808 length:741 start_codon:yes stop_codon:yes gene_type:complete